MKMRKPKSDSSKMGRYVRTQEINELASKNRKGLGTGDSNGMSSLENRKKVSVSKLGRKLAINPITKERKYVFPDNVPEGFVLR